MITLDKLQLYRSYKGDGDLFVRSGRPGEKALMSDDDWYLIDLLLQDATVLNRNLGSAKRNAEAKQRLRNNCENEEVVNYIRWLVEEL